MSLATKLKDLRVRRGQSLQQVADGVGVSKAHIWQLERGDSTNPSLTCSGAGGLLQGDCGVPV